MSEDEGEGARITLNDHQLLAPDLSGGRSRKAKRKSEVQKLSLLLEISKTLSSALPLRIGIQQVLGILERHHGAFRSAVTLLREGTHELYIEASLGLRKNSRRAHYHAG